MASSGRVFFKSAHASDTCFATVPGLVPDAGDHPVRPCFETSDKRLYVVSPAFTDRRQATFRPAPVSGRRARRPAAPRPRLLGTRLAAPASDAGAHRSLCGWLPRTATRFCLRRAAGNHVPPRGGKPEGLPDGVFGRAPVPQTRPQSGEDLPTGRLRRRRWRRLGSVPVQAAACP